MARGNGHRPPHNPAPVSLPGAASSRTDGGPSNPILLTTGLGYGEKQQLEKVAAAAPMAARSGPAGAGGPVAPPTGPPLPDMYGPTERPGEPITAGAAVGPGGGPLHVPPDEDEALWVAYEKAPSADLLAILESRRR
jgi:hypothetical protein